MKPREEHDRALLDDIREACALILERTKGVSFPDFVANRTLQDSIVLRLIVIGAAAKGLSASARARHKAIPWRDICRLRDRAVHHYWSIETARIWEIVQTDIPQLLTTIAR